MYKPLGNKVLVERIEGKKETGFGLILTKTDEVDRSVVKSIGSDVVEVELNDEVLVNWNKAVKIENELYVIPVTEIVCIFE